MLLLPSCQLTWLLKMAIEIVDLLIKNGGSFHSYVSLPEGIGIIIQHDTCNRYHSVMIFRRFIQLVVLMNITSTIRTTTHRHDGPMSRVYSTMAMGPPGFMQGTMKWGMYGLLG